MHLTNKISIRFTEEQSRRLREFAEQRQVKPSSAARDLIISAVSSDSGRPGFLDRLRVIFISAIKGGF